MDWLSIDVKYLMVISIHTNYNNNDKTLHGRLHRRYSNRKHVLGQ